MPKFLVVLGAIAIFLASVARSDENRIEFPKKYPSKFTNYLSLDRTQNPDQLIRLFANDIAMQGPDAEGRMPYGSILVGEVYTTKKDEHGNVMTSVLGRRIRDKLVLIAVMQREQNFGEKYRENLKNDDWEFAAFKPDGTVAEKDLNACRACAYSD